LKFVIHADQLIVAELDTNSTSNPTVASRIVCLSVTGPAQRMSNGVVAGVNVVPSVQSFLEFWDETNPPQAAMKTVMTPEVYQKALSLSAQLVDELNESHDGRMKLSSPYILVGARKPTS
jgi:hypothetical protein